MEAAVTAHWLESQELLGLHEVCPEPCRRALGLELVDLGGALVSLARREPSILLNRALGLGVGPRVSVEAVRLVMREFASRGIENYFVQLERDGVDASDEELMALGLEKARGWRRFERGIQPAPKTSSELFVRSLDPVSDAPNIAAFGQLVAASFGLAPSSAELFSAMAHSERWTLFMSFDGETPAGTGALLTAHDPNTGTLGGWFDMGTTAPGFRRRGGQFAVLAARIDAALAQGCTRLFTETGEAVPGDEQHSYKNILKCGFVAGSLKENWRPRSLSR